MTVKRVVAPERFIGISTDIKPTDGATSVRPGATFYERDTRNLQITPDGTNWYTKDAPDSIWTFGQPVLRAENNSVAYWSKGTTSPRNQKGGGWQACLHGNVQTGVDWAAVYIPVNELPVPSFQTAQWSYYMTTTQTMGVNIVIWVHDPDDFDYRAEITQLGGVAGLEKTSGWNAHEFDSTDAGMFYYGEITGTPDTTPTAGTQYTWAQFMTDSVFSRYTIYRISIEYGWEASGTFDQVWVADLMLNGQTIQLKPAPGDLDAPVFQYQTGTGAIAGALSPKTPFQLESIMAHFASAQTQDTLTITCDAGRVATVYDTLLFSRAGSTGFTDLVIEFGEAYKFLEDDEIDVTYTGTDGDVYGLTYCFKVLP